MIKRPFRPQESTAAPASNPPPEIPARAQPFSTSSRTRTIYHCHVDPEECGLGQHALLAAVDPSALGLSPVNRHDCDERGRDGLADLEPFVSTLSQEISQTPCLKQQPAPGTGATPV